MLAIISAGLKTVSLRATRIVDLFVAAGALSVAAGAASLGALVDVLQPVAIK